MSRYTDINPLTLRSYKMGARKILSLLAVLVLVAGCHKTPEDTASVTTSGDTTTMTAPMDGSAAPIGGGAIPGSEQDLVTTVGDRVFFGYDQYDLTAEARTQIEKQGQWLKTY